MPAFSAIRGRWARVRLRLVAVKAQVASASLALVLVAACAYAIHQKSEQDMASARAAFRAESALDTAHVAGTVEGKFEQVYGGLRTIGLLPSVRRIDRHGSNLDQDALASIQQLYNNLAGSVEISEVYVVPGDFNPDRIDPATGVLQAPTLMFDELIVDAGARARESGEAVEEEHAEAPEVEIFEYRELVRQLSWLRLHAPTNAGFTGLGRPMLSSQAVITCDNTKYIASGNDADRMGVILSVPFYDPQGRLAGVISAIIRTEALADYLPGSDYVLLNTAQALQIGAHANAIPQWAASGVPDPGLIYSEVLEIGARDPQGSWRLWVGKANAEFSNGDAARAVRTFELGAYIVLALLALSTLAAIAVLSARAKHRQQSTRHELLAEHAAAMSKMANEQADLKARADQANLYKSQFLANMSHELRTPLNAIIGYGEIVQEEAADLGQPQMVKDLDRVLSGGRHLLSLINSILDLSKVEAGRVDVELEEFDADDLILATAEFVRPAAEKKGLAFVVEQANPLGRVTSDPLKIKQCLLNLLSNAIKFTEHGRVTLRVERVPSPGGDVLVLAISDTGVGLNRVQMAKLFQPFAQADASITRTHGGTGLGLAITRNLCRLLGGDIDVTSLANVGSTFTMSVLATLGANAAQADDTVVAAPDSPRHERPIALIIDDEADARDLAQRALERAGFAVCVAPTAAQGLDLAAKCAPALVCLDLNLPDRSGWSVLAALTKDSAAPPVLVVSVEDCRAKSLSLGACGHLTKPLDRDQFTAAALRFARPRNSHLSSNATIDVTAYERMGRA